MAKPTVPATARLRELNRALEQARKLPKKDTLTSLPMAAMIGVSWPILRGWCRDFEGFAASKAFEAGDNGIKYRFKPVPTIEWLIKHFEAKAAAGDAGAYDRYLARLLARGDRASLSRFAAEHAPAPKTPPGSPIGEDCWFCAPGEALTALTDAGSPPTQ